jgi:hypothetical protein
MRNAPIRIMAASPGAHDTVSPRPYPPKLPPLDYPAHFLVKRVTDPGTMRFEQRLVYLANALDNYQVGLEEIDDGIWSIYFDTVLLARFDERDGMIREWLCLLTECHPCTRFALSPIYPIAHTHISFAVMRAPRSATTPFTSADGDPDAERCAPGKQ